MKKLVLLLSALLASTAGAGGIAVTNGYRMFAAAGIAVQYRAELTVQKLSATAFDISNRELVRESDRVSKVSFTVTKAPGKSLADVKAAMARRFPQRTLAEIQQPGAKGYYWEERSEGALLGHYDLLTSNGDLIDISLEAYAAADGIQWVAPIVHSLVYDNSGPTILEVKLENQTWEAGSTQKLRLRITDDYSGLDPELGFSYEAPNRGAVDESDKAYYYGTSELKSEGNDWYTAEVKVGKFTPNAKFRFSAFNLKDQAGNRRRYVANLNDAHYEAAPAAPGARVKTLRMRVKNRGPEDAAPPRLLGFRPDSAVWDVGSTHRIYFKIVDDVSGVSLADKEASISQPCSEFTIGEKRFCVGGAGVFIPYRSEGNGWYSAEYTVQDYLPSGEYRINAIVVTDVAGNTRMLRFEDDAATEPGLVSSLKVQINNPGIQDVDAPDVLEWKLDASSWKVGGRGKVYVRSRDGGSGVNKDAMSVSFDRIDGAPVPPIFTKRKGATKYEGNGWYAMEIELDQFLQAGSYYPSFLKVSDKAGNDTLADCQPDGTCQIRDGQALKLSAMPVEFVK